MATDLTEIGIKLSVDGAEETADKLDKVEKAGTKTEGSLKNIAKSANKTNGPFRAMRGSMQQVSWQLQDVAVQTQMGTDKLMILGQQGPQLASIFGPGGAVVGALIAFGSVLAGVILSSISKTSEELKVLEEQAKKNAEAFDDLTAAQQGVIVLETNKKIEAQTQILKDLNAELERETRKGPKEEVVSQDAFMGLTLTESDKDFADRLNAIQAKADNATAVLKVYRGTIDDLRTDTEKLVDKLTEQERVTGKTTKQIIMSTDAYKKATPLQKEQILALEKQIQTAKDVDAQNKKDQAETKKALEQKQAFIEKLDEQHQLLKLTGQGLYEYQAIQAGATGEEIKTVAAKIALVAALKEQIKTNAALAKANDKADKDQLKRAASASLLLEEIAQENMSELQQLEAHLAKKDTLLLEYLDEGEITLQEYLDSSAELQATYDLAEILANKEKNDKLLDADKAYADAKASLDNQVLSGAANVFGQLEGLAEEGSGAQKALFAIQKAIAIATTIVNTEASAVAATAPPPIGMGIAGAPYAAMIRAMGYASVGIMAGTSIAGGRALGGQVRGGESYLVGERGPELLTMGTSGRVTSNDALKNSGNGADVVINQTINVTTGIQSTVRAEIVALMPQISNAAKGAVADARLRGGNFSKAMAGA